MFPIRNSHSRIIEAPLATVGPLLDALASDRDRLWPRRGWPQMRLDRALAVGARGGHGPIRYSVTEYEPGRRVRFEFDPQIGFAGFHEFAVDASGPGRSVMRHDLVARATNPAAYLKWLVAIRTLHDTMLETLLDNAEQAATGRLGQATRWSPWLRVIRRTVLPHLGAKVRPDLHTAR